MFFRCLLAKLSVTNGLHFAVNPLCLLSWRYLLIADFDNDTLFSSRVLMTCCYIVGFLNQRKILGSSIFHPYMAHITCINISLDLILRALVKTVAAKCNFNSFISLICDKIMREQASPDHDTACQSIVQLIMSHWKCMKTCIEALPSHTDC